MPARTLTGSVVSDKSDKTIVVRVDHKKRHPIYSKSYTVSNKFSVHDEKNAARTGDRVQIQESRPISKTKSWQLVKVLEKAIAGDEPIEPEVEV